MSLTSKIISAAMCLAIGATAAEATQGDISPRGGFIKRDSRIEGCMAIIKDVREGIMTPTQWLEANKEEFRDLDIELRKRKYSDVKARKMLMGMAVSLCMERKGYYNKCAVDAGDDSDDDGDLQLMETSQVYSCWRKQKGAKAPSTSNGNGNGNGQPQIIINNNNVITGGGMVVRPDEIVPPPPPPPPPPVYVPPPWPPLPPAMSPEDRRQFDEDVGIIGQPVRIIGDDENGAKEHRFGSCASYWQSLHHNRPPNVRQVLYAVRVARCMYRMNFAVLLARCAPEFGSMLRARCYARFA